MDVRSAVVQVSTFSVVVAAVMATFVGSVDDEVPEVGFAAARALYALNDPEGKKTLLSVLSGETKVASGFISKQTAPLAAALASSPGSGRPVTMMTGTVEPRAVSS